MMPPKIVLQFVGAIVALFVSLLGLALLVQSAQAQTAADITPNTECGSPGVGRRSDGTIERRDIGSHDVYVSAEGVWTTPCPPPELTFGTACGAPGVGIAVDGRRYAWTKPGKRVNERGRWEDCDRACVPGLGLTNAFRTWSVGPYTCTTYSKYASSADDPARDRVLKHGEVGYWRQWQGGMRGHLIERCDDGPPRQVLGSTCAPATHCDVRWQRDGYVYDGRREPVPLGGVVEATAQGKPGSIRLECVAGDFIDRPARVVVQPRPPPQRPVFVGCQPQMLERGGVRAFVPRMAEGESLVVKLGARHAAVYCVDGRATFVAPTPATPASAAEALRPAR